MGIDHSFLHKTLKDPTRRDILHYLNSKEPLTYKELMTLSKVTNTGRFNYHLKALGDLIEKMNDGRYRLTERGRLAVQLLENVPEKTNKAGQTATGEVAAVARFSNEKVKEHADIPKKHLAAAVLVLIIGFSLTITVPVVQITVEAPSIQWQQFLPGISGTSVIQTSDGGYLALGLNASVQDGEPDVFVNQEPVLVKTDSSGNIIWTRTYEVEDGRLELSKVIQTSDGGYALGGVHIVENAYLNADNKISLMKLDSQGNVQWSKLLRGYNDTFSDTTGPNAISGLEQTSNEGYAVVAGYTHTMYISETWFVKTDSEGNLELNKTIRGGSSPISLVTASDGGLAIISEYMGRGGGSKFGIVKIDLDGNTQWTNTYIQPDSVSSYATCGIATIDDGYILGGYTILDKDFGWLVKTDSEGNVLWNKTYSYKGCSSDIQSISQTKDGGFIFVAAVLDQTDFGVFDADTQVFTWIVKTDDLGNIQGETAIAMGNHITHPTSIIQSNDDGYAFVGAWNESHQATSDQKFWLVKIADFRSIPSSIWLSIQLAIVAATIIIEVITALAIRKRVQKPPSY